MATDPLCRYSDSSRRNEEKIQVVGEWGYFGRRMACFLENNFTFSYGKGNEGIE